jgi:hypothetical protein
MRMVEARARYAARVARPGTALLIWRFGETPASEREGLYPSFAAALAACRPRLRDPRCRGLVVYDGRRLYDRRAIERLLQEKEV